MLYDNEEKIKDLLAGSLFLGGGGGGSPEEGYARAMSALKQGKVELISLQELRQRHKNSGKGYIVTFSGVGSPASESAFYSDQVYPRITKLIQKQLDGPIIGVIPCEIGASSSFETFIPAVLLDVPIIDAPCNGRAHPLGTMGSLGLERGKNHTIQAAAGGRENTDDYVEMFAEGSVEHTSALVRNAASLAGGAVAVCRNPVSLSYLEEHGAKGAYSLATEIGHLLRSGTDFLAGIEKVLAHLGGKRLCCGKVSDFQLSTDNALDYGSFSIAGYRIGFCNEFMTVSTESSRLYTFPDLITAFDIDSKTIVSTAQIENDQKLLLTAVPYKNLPLGAGLKNKKNYEPLERSTGEAFICYLDSLLK